MQLGFAMLEAGSVSRRNVQNILFKNLMDACLGAIIWLTLGFGVAYGKDGDNAFMGTDMFFDLPTDQHLSFFFQWAFCVAASTIVSGSVAERMKLTSYFIYTFVITAFIYPVVVHWVWDGNGWLSAFNGDEGGDGASIPVMDFAGSGVVHMVGGFSGLMGAIFVGPRPGRFDPRSSARYGSHSVPLQLFGTLILWYGWYGFNCGSTLAVDGFAGVANRVAVTTTLGAAAGGLTVSFVGKLLDKKWNITLACNGILAGLVSITAPCPIVGPGSALAIGAIGGLVYLATARMLIKLKIDDPLDASSVHGFCGFWGVVAVAIFATEDNISVAYSDFMAEMSFGKRLGYQLLGATIVLVWTCATSGLMFFLAKITVGLRTEKGMLEGLDADDFGNSAYELPAGIQVQAKTDVEMQKTAGSTAEKQI